MATSNPDLQRWPVDVADMMDYLSGPGWCMEIPKTKKDKSNYILGLRSLKDAAGPNWAAVLAGLLELAKDEYANNQKLPVWFPPGSPASLVKMARKMRFMQENPEPFKVEHRRRYVTGRYADAIEH